MVWGIVLVGIVFTMVKPRENPLCSAADFALHTCANAASMPAGLRKLAPTQTLRSQEEAIGAISKNGTSWK